MTLPKIIIQYNKFLDPIFIFYCQNSPEWMARGWHEWNPPSTEEIKKRVKNYQEIWRSFEGIILRSLCDVLELEFHRNVIDVHVVSGNPRQFSRPLVIKSGYSPKEFIITLTHELIHVLLSDNDDIKKLLPYPADLFPKFSKETKATQNHILVHAVLKYLYLDPIADPEMLEIDLSASRKHRSGDYTRAWEIVEQEGYLRLINEFKNQLQKYKKAKIRNDT